VDGVGEGENGYRREVRLRIGLWVGKAFCKVINPLNPELNPICYFWHY